MNIIEHVWGHLDRRVRAREVLPHNADEMWAVLKNDFQKTKPWLDSLTRKVKNSSSISEMTDSDMQDLGLIAFAFLRART